MYVNHNTFGYSPGEIVRSLSMHVYTKKTESKFEKYCINKYWTYMNLYIHTKYAKKGQ